MTVLASSTPIPLLPEGLSLTPHAGAPGNACPLHQRLPAGTVQWGLATASSPPSTSQTHLYDPAPASSSPLLAEIDPQ
jgi:hypothetical protein